MKEIKKLEGIMMSGNLEQVFMCKLNELIDEVNALKKEVRVDKKCVKEVDTKQTLADKMRSYWVDTSTTFKDPWEDSFEDPWEKCQKIAKEHYIKAFDKCLSAHNYDKFNYPYAVIKKALEEA